MEEVLTNCTQHHKMSDSLSIYNACILFCDCLKITKPITQKHTNTRNTSIIVNDRYHKNGTIFPFKKKKEKQTNQKNKEIKNMISGTDSIASGSCHVQKYHGFVFLVFNTLQQKNEEPLLFTLLGKKSNN